MGGNHARAVSKGSVNGCELAAVCDSNPDALAAFADVPRFRSSEELIRSPEVDAVLIATPHYSHTTVGIDALSHGLHVLVEKPISVHKADCMRLLAARRGPDQVFAAMFNERTNPRYRRVRELIQGGRLGELRRVNWVITSWFRSQCYYDSGTWRATWAGEGGGVLLNQCPHQLDLLWWLCGMPERIRAFCGFGKHHAIEVEDEVTAYLEYPGGATGLFLASTGELPGTNRLEIVGDRARVLIDGEQAFLDEMSVPTREYIETSEERFAKPETRRTPFPAADSGGQHREILQNFVDAIRTAAPLIAPAEEGIHSVELANAMIHSCLTEETVEMPLDEKAYETKLQEMIDASPAARTASRHARGKE